MRIVGRIVSLASFSISLIVLAAATMAASAQQTAPNEWTWQWSSPTGGPFYGTPGVFAAQNGPGPTIGGTVVIWVDAGGNLWFYAGGIWVFDPSTLEWAWIDPICVNNCNGDPPAVWGTLGTPSASNLPGGRSSPATTTDTSGNVWLFGGLGNDVFDNQGDLNDLWKYTPSNGEWEWVAGSNSFPKCLGIYGTNECVVAAVYGTLGVPAKGNTPGGRIGALSWADTSGHFWLYGGTGVDGTTPITEYSSVSELSDMWEFDPANAEWTWIAGSSTAYNPSSPNSGWASTLPVFGTQGVPAPTTTPGWVQGAAAWTDRTNHFWVFGGSVNYAPASSGPDEGFMFGGPSNDLWEFDPSIKQWTWWGGSTVIGGLPGYVVTSNPVSYGTLGVPSPSNLPGPRSGAVTWTDNAGNFWLFGGLGIDAAGTTGPLNDLWELNPTTREWTWMSGSSTIPCAQGSFGCNPLPSVYGTKGVPAPTNEPGATTAGEVGATDSDGNLWLYTTTADFWEFHPSTALPKTAPPVLSVGEGTYTTAQSVNVTDATSDAKIYYTLDGTLPTESSAVYSGPITISTNTTLQAIAASLSHFDSAVVSATYTITPGFAVAASPSSFTVKGGSSGTTTITVSPAGGFDSAVSFACSGLPAGATCSFLPATVTPPGTTSTVLTVTTASASAALRLRGMPVWPGTAVAVAFCWVGWKRRRSWPMLVVLALSLAGAGLVNGCGGGSSGGGGGGGGGGGTQPVTSTVTVTATSGTLQESTTFSLTVD